MGVASYFLHFLFKCDNVLSYCYFYFLKCANTWKCLSCRVQSDRQMYWRCKKGLLFLSRRLFFFFFTSCTRRIYCLTVWMSMLSQFHVPVQQGSYCNNVFTQMTIIAATGCKDPNKHISPSFNLSSNGVVISNKKKK